jgi:ABC-type transporter Mla subunit MlaD
MRAAIPVALVLVVATLVAFVLVSRSDEETYRVRAIFDNAGFIIPGEDVKVAGVKVGSIEDVEVTPEFKAAVVLRINDPGYQDFRADAHCMVRPQSLIGERFVECEPTQKHAVGQEAPGPLRKIDDGPGKGQYLLPVENTGKAVDLDLLNNIMREPERARLSIILNELGVGLAGRGSDLEDVIQRANPALKNVDELIRMLANQNQQLEQLAVDSDRIMAPLAQQKDHVANSIENMSKVAEATAERRADLEANLERLPEFLRQLRPTMTRLGALADEMTPVVSDLGDAAPDINRLLIELGPFSSAGIPAMKSLGEAGKIGTPAITNARPIIRDLNTLAKAARPVGKTLRQVLVSLDKQDAIEAAMTYTFFQATAVNGFDSFGHYLRAGLIVNQCSTYAVNPTGGCGSKFATASATANAAGADSMPRDKILLATARALAGLDPRIPQKAPKKHKGKLRDGARKGDKSGRDRGAGGGGGGGGGGSAIPAPVAPSTPSAPARAATPAPQAAPPSDDGLPLLDYLFGGGN